MSVNDSKIHWDRVKKYVDRENLNTYWRTYGMPAVMSVDTSNISGAEQMPKWQAHENVAISAAINGAFFTRNENPAQPITPEEIIQSAEECIAEGAQIIHLHARDEQGYNVLDPVAFGEVIRHLRKQHNGIAVDACLVSVNDEESADLRAMLSTGLLDAVPVNTTAIILGDNLFVKPPHVIIEKTRLILDAGLKPQLAVYTDGDIDNARRLLIDSGLLGQGQTWLVVSGLPGCTPMYTPNSMVDGLMRQVRLIREVDPEARIVVCAGGRASSHVATLGLLLGLHIRVGMEDTVWKWPHSDEKISRNAAAFAQMRDIALGLGRELMSGEEYRTLMSA
ncbi:beta-keto acid cleavage family enzyme [Devosia sp. A369]